MEYHSTTPNIDWYKHRLIGAIYFVVAAFAILIIRLFYLQIIEGQEYRRLSENNCIRLQTVDPPRGLIFDRNGGEIENLLVDNRPSFDLSIIPKDAKPLKDTIKKLSQFIKMPEGELFEKIDQKKALSAYKPILLKSDIERDALAAIEVHKFDLPGVVVDVKPRRNYIQNQFAAHLIGYLSEINPNELKREEYFGYNQGDIIGKYGVERSLEKFLRGKPGGQQVEVNATGQVVRVIRTVDSVPGHNVILTIDQKLQKIAEEQLMGLAGSVAAMDPMTGHILALASSPSFDQNIFVGGLSHDNWDSLISNPFRPMENKVIQGEYPPASVYKIVTALAGVEEGIVDENTVFHCPGFYKYGDRVFRCWKKGGHGTVNITRALAESCDVFFYQVGQQLGVDRLAWYAKACGLGSPTGVDLDHEKKGLVPSSVWKKERYGISWQRGETLSVAIGQGYNLVTPMQLLVLTAAVANGGYRKKPIIVDRIETAEGNVVYTSKSKTIGKLPVKEKTLKIIKEGLWSVVNKQGGTARTVHLDDIEVSGKTGTAQVVGRKNEGVDSSGKLADRFKPHAWFVAFAPSADPKIAVVAMVENGEHGSSSAGPIAKEVIKTYLRK